MNWLSINNKSVNRFIIKRTEIYKARKQKETVLDLTVTKLARRK